MIRASTKLPCTFYFRPLEPVGKDTMRLIHGRVNRLFKALIARHIIVERITLTSDCHEWKVITRQDKTLVIEDRLIVEHGEVEAAARVLSAHLVENSG